MGATGYAKSAKTALDVRPFLDSPASRRAAVSLPRRLRHCRRFMVGRQRGSRVDGSEPAGKALQACPNRTVAQRLATFLPFVGYQVFVEHPGPFRDRVDRK